MRHLYMVAHVRYLLAFLLLTTGLIASSGLYAQQLKITDFALFGGNGACPSGPGQTAPPSPGCAVLIGPGSSVTGGSVGSYTLVTTNSNATISGNIYSGGTVQMSSSNS